jgi:hypothetical protein
VSDVAENLCMYCGVGGRVASVMSAVLAYMSSMANMTGSRDVSAVVNMTR